MERLLARRTTWDGNLEGGAGYAFAPESDWVGLFKARVGVTLVRDSLFETLGLTYQYSAFSPATLGGELEIAHAEHGFWGQVGGFYDLSSHGGGSLALGWAAFGLEAQYRGTDAGPGFGLYAKLRLPVSVIVQGLAD
jgi:hypothetical protein